MNKRLFSGVLLAAGLTAVLTLTGCAQLRQLTPGGGQPGASAQSAQSSSPSGSQGGQKGQEDQEVKTIQGTLNQVDAEQEYLVLVADEAYCRFDCSDSGADLSGLEPGDSVTITYTGTLDEESDDVTAKLVTITKD